MIEFEVMHGKNGIVTDFSVSGHSGYAESGSDIVCAAVSSAVWMAVGGIERQNLADITYSQDDGFVKCHIPEKRLEGADALLKSLEYIMEELEKQYSRYVKVICKD